MEVPFWEESYKDDNVFAFGTEANETVKEFQHLIDKSGNILDAGCGDGMNCLHFAGLGYLNVDAFDISTNAIKKLSRIAEKKKLKVNAWAQDLTQYTFSKQFDLVISFGTLHFVKKESWKSFLMEAKENTKPKGIHIIQLFTNVLPASPDIAPFAVGLADDEEIKDIYRDWDILQFKSYSFEDEHPGVPKHWHASNKLVAQKL